MRQAVVIVACAVLIVAPATARAATVAAETHTESGDKGGSYPLSTLTYKAAPGEVNLVSIRADGTDAYVVDDSGAPLTAGGSCTQVSEHEVRCAGLIDLANAGFDLGGGNDSMTVGDVAHVGVVAGPGDDRVTSTTAGARLDGGAGDDVLTGGSESDQIAAGPGHDTVSAGAGNDEVSDGSDLNCGESDSFDGGAGRDSVDYRKHTCAVRIDLGDLAHSEGARGEGDRLASFEGVTGGKGNDELFGSDAPVNGLDGGPGDDHIVGRGGADYISGDAGEDTISGGSGNDIIDDGLGHTVVAGGPGRDSISTGDLADHVSGGPGSDRIRPGAGADRIDAGAGNDSIERDGLYNPSHSAKQAAHITCGTGRDYVSTLDWTAAEPQPSWDVLSGCEDVGVGFRETVGLRSVRRTGLGVFAGCSSDAAGSCLIRVTVRTSSGQLLADATREVPRFQFRNWSFRFPQPVAPGAGLQIAVSRRFDYTSRTRRRHHELGSFWLRLPSGSETAVAAGVRH